MLVLDAMVAIHLAKITLLETCCRYFKDVAIPSAIYDEIMAGKARGYPDATLIEELVRTKALTVRSVKEQHLIMKGRAFNVQQGEAEALALYWQEHAAHLASDDASLRTKRIVLDLRLIGTPVIILSLYRARLIDKEKLLQSVEALKTIGWFSSAVIDTMLGEAQ